MTLKIKAQCLITIQKFTFGKQIACILCTMFNNSGLEKIVNFVIGIFFKLLNFSISLYIEQSSYLTVTKQKMYLHKNFASFSNILFVLKTYLYKKKCV